MSIFINGSAQISLQKPLCEEWMSLPISYNTVYNRALETDFRQYINPMEARRMSPIVKRAIITSHVALQQSGVVMPDAVIVGTGLGCIDNTEKFLNAMVTDGENFLKPTYFIQSTHNTVASQIALALKCHGYNSTYVHHGVSFESALLDAFMQFKLGKIHTALVGGHDEMTPEYVKFLGKIGYWKSDAVDNTLDFLKYSNKKGAYAGEGGTTFVLSDQINDSSQAELKDIKLLYKPDKKRVNAVLMDMLHDNKLNISDIDVVMLGLNGDYEDDSIYYDFVHDAFNYPDRDVVFSYYKHLSGEYFTSSAFGLYVASVILYKQYLPDYMKLCKSNNRKFHNMLIYNHWQNKDHSLMLLSCIN